MEKLKSFIIENKFNLFLLIIWAIIVCFSMYFHEIWRDEAQVWCIVRDLGFLDVLKMSRIEGHPFLWYLILFPFAKLGFSVSVMQIICFLFVFAAVLFFLFKSPFRKFDKFIIVFSAGLIYYLPVIARNYALIPLFLFITAYLYPKRHENPFLYVLSIIILSYTHLYMLGFCLILSFLFVIEKIKENYSNKNIKRFILSLPVWFLVFNFLILFITFFNIQDENYALDSGIRMGLSFFAVLNVVAKVFCYNLFLNFDFAKNHFGLISNMLFYPFIAIILFSLFKSDKKAGLICFCSIAYIFCVFTKVYFNGILYQKSFIIFLILIFCFWIIKKENSVLYKTSRYSFLFLMIISFLTSPLVIYEDFKYNFSGGKQIAEYINKNLKEENTFIAIGNPFLYSSVSAYLPDKKLYNAISKSYISYYTYLNSKNSKITPFPIDARYSIVQENIDISQNPYVNIIFKGDEKNISSKTEREVFSIYVTK